MFIIFGRLPLKMDFMYFVYFMCVEIMCVHTATWENSQWLNVLPCINILEKNAVVLPQFVNQANMLKL